MDGGSIRRCPDYDPFAFHVLFGLYVPLLRLLLKPGLHGSIGGVEDQ